MERSMDGLKERLNKTMKNCIDNSSAIAADGIAVLREYAGNVCEAMIEKVEGSDEEKMPGVIKWQMAL